MEIFSSFFVVWLSSSTIDDRAIDQAAETRTQNRDAFTAVE